MAKVDANDFYLNTDYEMDKIVYFNSGEMTPGAKTIAHKLNFTPLVFAVCAFNSDFSDTRMTPYIQWTSGDAPIDFQVTQSPTDILINYHNPVNSNQKLYYRIYAFEPSNKTTKIGPTSKYANKLILNTDYNYCKLYKKGVTRDTSLTITHNFGYVPFVMGWNRTTQHYLNDEDGSVTANKNEVKIYNPNGTPFHYRIYYDEV